MRKIEPIKINMFDGVGIFKLKDVKHIENLVSDLGNGEYLSRGLEYYKQRTVQGFCNFREELKRKLDYFDDPLKQFVVIEHMLNCSARALYNELISPIKMDMYLCKACVLEDVKNIIRLFEGKPIEEPMQVLPKKADVVTNKVLELDNKALLYAFCKAQNLAIDCLVVTPGFGSILIGPFLKVIKNFDYELIDFSVHKKSIKGFNLENYAKIIDAINNKKTILLLDDNVVSGRTLSDIKIIIDSYKGSVMCGAVQFDWQNYYEQSKENLDLYKFKLKFLNIVTLIAFYGEDFLENIKTCIVKKPSLYYDMLSAYSMNDKGENDILGLFKLGEKFAKKAKIKIHWPVKHGKEGLNKYSIKLNNDLKKMFK